MKTRTIFLLVAMVLPALAGCRSSRRVEHSVPSLVKVLKTHKDPNMRYWAAEALGKFGREAQPAVPDLIAALEDQHKVVRVGAAYALAEIGSADAVPALQKATASPEKDVRDAATYALRQIQAQGQKR